VAGDGAMRQGDHSLRPEAVRSGPAAGSAGARREAKEGARGDGGHPRARPRRSTPKLPRVPAVLLDRRGGRPLLRQMGQRLRNQAGSGLVAVLPGGRRIRADHNGRTRSSWSSASS
jgi:hypothetical protein